MSHHGNVMYQRNIKDFGNVSGRRLIFVVMPEALSIIPGAAGWTIIFFLLLMLVGLDTQVTLVHTVLAGIVDEWATRLYSKSIWLLLVLCCLLYLCGLPMVAQVCRFQALQYNLPSAIFSYLFIINKYHFLCLPESPIKLKGCLRTLSFWIKTGCNRFNALCVLLIKKEVH